MRIGLVLGAGGVLGGAWLTGALEALAAETGWEAANADHVIGTSAGSVLAALIAGGVASTSLSAEDREAIFEAVLGQSGEMRRFEWREQGAPWWRLNFPGSLGMCVSGRGRARAEMFFRLVCGIVPHGVLSGRPIESTINAWAGEAWPEPRNCWIVACDYHTGRRIAFGRTGAPDATLGQAVAASCAIPGYYRPQRIGGRLYVDGGVHSMSNLDLLGGLGLDLVVVLSPLSSHHAVPFWRPLGRVLSAYRWLAARQVEAEASVLRSQGTEVVIIEPTGDDIAAMGVNLMNAGRRHQVLELAQATVAEQLRGPDIARRLKGVGRSPRRSRLAA
jgi:NTE family protein